MKVENNNINPTSPQKPEGMHRIDKNSRPVDSTSSMASRDRAELSERARLLSKARTSMNEVSDVRTERVDDLKKQVTEGTYNIPYNELARLLYSKLGR